jgi:signal transduction histidine kinase/DNA-binding response OmpR family regulator/streptogramin lyase
MILAIHLERSGTIWISSFTGLNKINRKERPFTQYNNFESSWDNSFGSSAIIANSDNNSLWIEAGNEILKFDPPNGTFVSQFSLQSVGATYIAGDNSGNIWMKHFTGGLSLKEMDGKLTRIQYSSGKEFDQQVYCLYSPPSSDTVWVGTLEGDLLSISKKTKTISFVKSIRTSIKCIYKDTFGILWAGTKDAGLFQYNESEQELILFKSNVNDPRSITSNFITTIHEDKKGNVWFGTNIGLNKYNRSTQSFIHFTEKEGLPNNLIFAIEEDAQGNLWFSTDNGISKLNPETGKIKNYDISYGFTTNRFYFTGCKTENGEIYFGGPGGITRFHPDSIKANPYIPPIVITSFRIFDKLIPFSKKIELDYDKNFLSFEFAALSYLSPQRNQYAYKMEGVDENWIYSGTRRYASYTNMEPGQYIFRVKGSNNDGVWNEEGTSITITILPPFWKTWWAYLSYAGIFILVLLGIRRYEMNRISYKNQTKLDKVVLIEKEETEKLKSRFFANISHEFRTPLTLILGPAEKIISKSSDENITKDASIIKRNSKRLLQLVNQLLDLSKIEAGKLKLEVSKGNIVSFVKGIALSFESLSESKDITLNILSAKEFIELYFDKEKMIKILTNLLSNAFKFTPEEGRITISINEKFSDGKEGTLEIKIRDTGIGISPEEIPKLFDRFYQVDSSHTREYEGTGIGLALTKELVDLHHGRIAVESEQGRWTEFTLEFSLGRDHFKDDDILNPDIKSEISKILIDDEKYFHSKNIDEELDRKLAQNKNIILVVEDNYDMRKYIKESVGEEYIVEEAVNGEQGVRRAEKIIPDLIISDMMMPKMDGNELVRILKNNEKTSHIPIILLTARSEQQDKIEGLQKGADDYLTKPFDLKELQARIKNLIEIRRKLQAKYSKLEYVLKSDGKKVTSLDEKFLNKVKEVIENHISEEEFNMDDFCSEVAMSRTQLHRKLKALTGKSATLYIRTIKLLKAKKMIQEKTGNISEIAYSLGFSSPTYFTRCFKEEFGYPPSEITE